MKFAPDGTPLTRWTRLSLAVIVTLAGICLSIAASLLYDIVKDCVQTAAGAFPQCVIQPGTPAFWKAMLTLVLLLACIGLSYFGLPIVRSAFVNSNAYMRRRPGQLPEFPGVIFALSLLSGYQGDEDGLPSRSLEKPSNSTKAVASALEIVAGVKDRLPQTQMAALDLLCDAKGEFAELRWSWQQPLRILRHNHATLRVLCAVLSEDAEKQFALFQRIVKPLLRPGTQIVRVPGTVKRDEYKEIFTALDIGIKLVQATVGNDPEDICVDTTGGTGIFSAVAVVKTLNSRLQLSYIPTFDGPDVGNVVIFDATISA